MPTIEEMHEEGGYYVITGNHLDILIIKMEQEVEYLDYQHVELESKALANIDAIVEGGGLYKEFNSPEDVEKELEWLSTEGERLNKFIKRVREAIEKDGTSELKITHKD